MDLQALAANLGMVAGILVAVGVIMEVVRRMWRTVRRINTFLDQWFGDPAADPPRKSLPDRMSAMERQQQEHLDQHHGSTVRPMRRGQGG